MAALAVVILVGAVVLFRGHGGAPVPSAQEAAASGALAASAQQAAASAAPSPPAGQAAASAAAPQPPQEVAAIAPLQPTAALRAAAGSAGCVVADPTPTPLNVRVTPNGQIAQTHGQWRGRACDQTGHGRRSDLESDRHGAKRPDPGLGVFELYRLRKLNGGRGSRQEIIAAISLANTASSAGSAMPP